MAPKEAVLIMAGSPPTCATLDSKRSATSCVLKPKYQLRHPDFFFHYLKNLFWIKVSKLFNFILKTEALSATKASKLYMFGYKSMGVPCTGLHSCLMYIDTFWDALDLQMHFLV